MDVERLRPVVELHGQPPRSRTRAQTDTRRDRVGHPGPHWIRAPRALFTRGTRTTTPRFRSRSRLVAYGASARIRQRLYGGSTRSLPGPIGVNRPARARIPS